MKASPPLGAAPVGLTAEEARDRLEVDGPNVLPRSRPTPAWRELLGQMTHFFALMLWAASVLAVVAGMPQLAVAIVLVIVINGVFAFAQEHRAEQAAERLRDLLPSRVRVIRDGERATVDATELVRGDLVALESGDRICADLEVIEAHSLLIDTSLLTGESVPDHVAAGATAFAGTFVVEGEGHALVRATGDRTRLASIAHLALAKQRPTSPLALELHRLVSTIAKLAVAVGVAFFALAVALGTDPSEGFLFAIGVTVALVPEGLLPTVTLSLAVGAQRMAERHALVRHLESVETLGSTTVICTDKTGTLTRNEMAVLEVWTPAGVVLVSGTGYAPDATVTGSPEAVAAARHAADVGGRCSSGRVRAHEGSWVAEGDPMEAAIDALVHRLGDPSDGASAPVTRRYPFDPRRRRMSVLAGDRLLVKGAPEAVLPRCRPGPGAAEEVDRLAAAGFRVLAVAERAAGDLDPHLAADEVEVDLELLALLALEDPPRPDVADAIGACREAGIAVVMVTGDHPATAAAIADQTGLRRADDPVVDGGDLPTDDGALAELVDHDGLVVARVSPEDKLRIATALQSRGHVVAMTGDGVNDAPALEQADIGVAMGRSGSDVARQAADLVLLDDNFATIVVAVEHGRGTFANVRRFLTYHLTDNVAELTPFVVWAVSGGRIPLALGVLQIVCLDIGTDVLPALALGVEPPSAAAAAQPQSGRLLDRSVLRRAFGVLGPTEAAAAMGAFLVTFVALGWRPGDPFPEGESLAMASGAAFAAVVVGQAANAFACRSTTRPVLRMRRPGRLFATSIAVQLLLLGLLLGVPPLAELLGQAVPPAPAWVAVGLAAVAVIAADSMHKFVRRRRAAPDRRPPATRP